VAWRGAQAAVVPHGQRAGTASASRTCDEGNTPAPAPINEASSRGRRARPLQHGVASLLPGEPLGARRRWSLPGRRWQL